MQGEAITGETVVVELRDGVTASIVSGIYELGWWAENVRRPYEIGLHVAVDNASEELAHAFAYPHTSRTSWLAVTTYPVA